MKSKTAPTTKITGKVSVEQLHHFRCGQCDKWWSIGDPAIAKNKTRKWFCPWCGIQQTIKNI